MMEKTLQGGTRFDGQSPVKVVGLPVVSVITVVYNGLSLIEKTIGSILSQTYLNIEYIVIDGGSSDGTAEIIRLNEKHIAYWISEPDKGIYDAMNKGLAAATGDFVWFMNAGDRIYESDTVEKIFASVMAAGSVKQANAVWPGIYYGDAMIVDSSYHEVGLRRLRPPEVLTWKSFRKGMLVSHQAILVSRSLAEPFDPQYRHSADFDWVVKALKKAEGKRAKGQEVKAEGKGAEGQEVKAEGRRAKGQEVKEKEASNKGGSRAGIPGGSVEHGSEAGGESKIVNTRLILCAFLDGGHSKQNIGISLKERFHSMVRHYGMLPTLVRHIPIGVRFVWFYLRNKRF